MNLRASHIGATASWTAAVPCRFPTSRNRRLEADPRFCKTRALPNWRSNYSMDMFGPLFLAASMPTAAPIYRLFTEFQL